MPRFAPTVPFAQNPVQKSLTQPQFFVWKNADLAPASSLPLSGLLLQLIRSELPKSTAMLVARESRERALSLHGREIIRT